MSSYVPISFFIADYVQYHNIMQIGIGIWFVSDLTESLENNKFIEVTHY